MKSGKILLLFLLPALMMTDCGGGGGGGGSSQPAPTLVSIAVTPAGQGISSGATEQFTATGTYSDNSTRDLTAAVTWSSSGTSVATISSNGLAASVSTGTIASGGNNVLSITVNGSGCNAYFNEPCVSVTVCTHGSSTCQVINNILLDTGSYGLRIFKKAINGISLTQETVGSNSLAECIQFADGSADWGPVMTADVVLGGEPAVQVPLQVIDPTFVSSTVAASSCPGTLETPLKSYNGILGVGVFAHDCGSTCVSKILTSSILYFACSGSACSGTTVPLSQQVQNPVAFLPTDNNGVIVELPAVSAGGAASVNGSLVLGIGTQSNNAPPASASTTIAAMSGSVSGSTTLTARVAAYPTDTSGDIGTIFNNITYSGSFIDTGSNGLFFPSSGLSSCPTPNSVWFCPSSTTDLSATITGSSGSPASGGVPFQIDNFNSLVSSNPSGNVFPDIGGNGVGSFDWGLPFFFGRNVYVGIEGTSSSLGSGPYFAF